MNVLVEWVHRLHHPRHKSKVYSHLTPAEDVLAREQKQLELARLVKRLDAEIENIRQLRG